MLGCFIPTRQPSAFQRLVLVLTSLALLFGVGSQAAKGADPAPSMSTVIKVVRANLEQIKVLDLTWTEDNYPNNGILDEGAKRRFIKDYSTGRYRYEEWQTFADGRKDFLCSTEAFNGKVRTVYPSVEPRTPSFHAGYIVRVRTDASGQQEAAIDGGYDPFAAGAPESFLFPSHFFEYLAACKVHIGKEEATDHGCVVADHYSGGAIDGQIVLDMEHGGIPVHQIVFEKRDHRDPWGPFLPGPRSGIGSELIATVPHQFKGDNGASVWLATKVNRADVYGSDDEEVDIALTKLNPNVDPQLFRVVFPKGSAVFNVATGSFFTTDPNDPSIDDRLPFRRPTSQPAGQGTAR